MEKLNSFTNTRIYIYRVNPCLNKCDLKKQNQSRPSAGNPKSEYLNPKRVKEDTVLKKQSQFVPAMMGVTPFTKGDYDDMPVHGTEENKANQSQFHAPAQQKRAAKKEKLLSNANSLAG